MISRRVTLQEINQVVYSYSLGGYKSPGPDGFNACFYKNSWEVTGVLVYQAMSSFDSFAAL